MNCTQNRQREIKTAIALASIALGLLAFFLTKE